MKGEYTTLSHDVAVVQNTISKSVFIGYAKGVDSVQDAESFVNEVAKKHYDATHNCFAYIVDDRAKYSDNGEPQGTAGMPIYDCIKKQSLNGVCVVVTRYFGGVKLGAGGLVRAYGGTCSDVLASATKVHMRSCVRFDIVVDYSLVKVVQRALGQLAKCENIIYDTSVTLCCLALEQSYDTITNIVVENTLGKAVITVKDRLICPF